MGIRGLTTFIQNQSHVYFEQYELHDTNAVLDGYSIASQLYRWHCKSNECFGGDYDKYANVIINFFKLLDDCNVTPYVVLDGGYENRKVATILDRMRNRIASAKHLTSVTEGNISVFPLLLRDVFVNTVLRLNKKCVQCDFEGDTETACIAKYLNCPVISFDSDYYIFGVLYIPFNTFQMGLCKKSIKQGGCQYNYISCQIYKAENFLNAFQGFHKDNLALMAVLLGNDYIKKSVFSEFFQHLKIQKTKSVQNEQQRKIKSVILWLQNETFESGVRKVLSRYKKSARIIVAEKIGNAIKGYKLDDSTMFKYLEVPNSGVEVENLKYSDKHIMKIAEEVNDLEDGEEQSSEDDANPQMEYDFEDDEDVDENSNDLPLFFLDKYRKCLYPPCVMDMLTKNSYICAPQIEDYSDENPHFISFKVLSAIHRILTFPKNEQLTCIARDEHSNIKKYTVPLCNVKVPSLSKLQNMDITHRRKVLLKILNIEEEFVTSCLNLFPDSWHIFTISLKYFMDNTNLKDKTPYLFSLILCTIVLNYVDKNVGFYRSSNMFLTKFNDKIQMLLKEKSELKVTENNQSIRASLTEIDYNDSLLCLHMLIHYFQMDIKMKSNYKLFNIKIIHKLAQFQTCLYHIKCLNSVLNYPFSNCIVFHCYDGTFNYNIINNFLKRSNLEQYVKTLLKNSPKVLTAYELILKYLKESVLNSTVNVIEPPKKRKKKKKSKEKSEQDVKADSSEENCIYDPSNKFSVLANVQ